MPKKKKNIGSSFDSFLDKEGLLIDTTVESLKRVLSWQIVQTMENEKLSKAAMAKKMNTSRSALDRLLDPENSSVTLKTLHRAAAVLGKQIRIELVG